MKNKNHSPQTKPKFRRQAWLCTPCMSFTEDKTADNFKMENSK